MNIFERLANIAGRAKGQYERGIQDMFSTSGAKPSVTDNTAYIDPFRWGVGLGKGNVPQTKSDYIDSFVSWAYVCASMRADAFISVPMRLYAAKATKGKKLKWAGTDREVLTRAVPKSRLRYLHGKANLAPVVKAAEEIEEVLEHPFLELFKAVNPQHTASDLKWMTELYISLTGECYWYKERGGLKGESGQGLPKRLWVVPSHLINPEYGKSKDKAIDHYVYKGGATELKIPVEDIVMLFVPNLKNTFAGFATIKAIADSVFIQTQMDEFEKALFRNRARVGGIIEQTERVGGVGKERLQESFSQKHEGTKNAGKTIMLPFGMKYTRDTLTPQELNFHEGRGDVRQMICSAFSTPEALFGIGANRAQTDTALDILARFGTAPTCTRIEEKVNDGILKEYDPKLFVVFDDPIPRNRALEMQERKTYITSGAETLNDARDEMGKEPYDDPMADVPLIPSNLVPLSMAGQQQQQGGGSQEDQAEEFGKRVANIVKKVFE